MTGQSNQKRLTEATAYNVVEGVLVAGISKFAAAICRTLLQALYRDRAKISWVRSVVGKNSRSPSNKGVN